MASPNPPMGAPVRYLCGVPVYESVMPLPAADPQAIPAIPLPDAITAPPLPPRHPTAQGEEQSLYPLANRDHALLGTPRELFPQTTTGALPTPFLFPHPAPAVMNVAQGLSGPSDAPMPAAMAPHMQMAPVPAGGVQDALNHLLGETQALKARVNHLVEENVSLRNAVQAAQAGAAAAQAGATASEMVVRQLAGNIACEDVPPSGNVQPTPFPPSVTGTRFGPHVNGSSPTTSNLFSPSTNKGPKLPTPKVIDEAFLRQYCGNIPFVRARLELIADYLAPGVAMSSFTWQAGFRPFMVAEMAMGFVGTYFLEDKAFVREDFIQAFLAAVSGDVRPGDVIALDELHAGKVTQGSDPVAKYNERFLQRSRQLRGESQMNLCRFYLSGLSPDLREKCCLDRDNKRWDSLTNLITFTLAEEERVMMTQSKSNFPKSLPSKNPFLGKQESLRRHYGKRPAGTSAAMVGDDEGDGDTEMTVVAAADETPTKRNKGAGGTPQKRPALQQVMGQPVVFADGSKVQWKIKPAKGYFLLGNSAAETKTALPKGLQDKHRKELHERGICWWCKQEGHGASECSLKR